MNPNIKIIDWAGNILFQGPCDDEQVDVVLNANRCDCDKADDCRECNQAGYSGDFSVEWEDSDRSENVYEFINY